MKLSRITFSLKNYPEKINIKATVVFTISKNKNVYSNILTKGAPYYKNVKDFRRNI